MFNAYCRLIFDLGGIFRGPTTKESPRNNIKPSYLKTNPSQKK